MTSDNGSMKKKYLLVSLLAASALLSGCAATDDMTPPSDQSTNTGSVTTGNEAEKVSNAAESDSAENLSKDDNSTNDEKASDADASKSDSSSATIGASGENNSSEDGETRSDDSNKAKGVMPDVSPDENAPAPEIRLNDPSHEDKNVEIDFEAGAMKVVELPANITKDEDYPELNLEKVSGSVVELENETLVTYDTYDKAALKEWVKDLKNEGWHFHENESVDTKTAFNALLTKGDKTVAIYSYNNNSTKGEEKKSILISFSE